ncbi:MAG TPA: dipeptide/oligopeptide/nickel ABC transporter ATP-binding protein [Clostridiaceae bacterium]|nr:dipeptide/oligopeptide/nickel ABC transporter ATP-binding protein [Clostridiaceae bacterium]
MKVIYKTDSDTICAVNGIDLILDKEQTLGIVGETGAGKTTTALSILRLLPQDIGEITEGQIIFEGKDLISAKESDMRKVRGEKISMIFQDPMTSLNPVLTVGQQLYEALELHNTQNKSKSQLEARVDEMLELVGIPKNRKREYPHQFSGGMKQRVVIAIALACSPVLVIADEPTTALDVTIQAQVLAMMSELKNKLGMSMILITHDLGVVAQNCDKVAIMYAGEIVENGIIEDIFEGVNHHPYTEGLFGSIPDLTRSTKRLNPIDGLMPDPINLPAGCTFHPRCPKCMDICRTKKPEPFSFGSHVIKCHFVQNSNQ